MTCAACGQSAQDGQRFCGQCGAPLAAACAACGAENPPGHRFCGARAIELLRSLGARPLLARALFERARRREDRDALDEARAIYAELGATRWLARIDQRTGVAA